MCFILMIAFVMATVAFFTKGLIPHAIISGIIASISLFFFIRKLIFNGRCIFGKADDCNTKKDV